MFHSVSLLSQAPLACGSRALPSVLFDLQSLRTHVLYMRKLLEIIAQKFDFRCRTSHLIRILSHGAQLRYMLRAADMTSSRLADRFLRFHSSKCTVAFLHPFFIQPPFQTSPYEQRETNIQPLSFKSSLASQIEMVVICTSRVW